MNKNNKLEHLAIIMDGNGRWAIKRKKPRLFGHKAGIESLKRTIDACLDFNIKYLTIFAFSTENWSRPQEEVNGIMNIANQFCDNDLQTIINKGVKVLTMGDISRLPDKLEQTLYKVVDKTKNNSKLVLNIAINYGARAEIIRAVNNLLSSGIKECTEKEFESQLYTSGLPDPDLIIRASGENRLSNFMLYQCAYSEFYFPKVHWPDFNKKVIQKAIKVYSKRHRRFGGL
ncbi:MAG: isoprenyl transferase [Clostridiales bacterium]|nr:isoprenyl transferase [Clostridiales bacterium]